VTYWTKDDKAEPELSSEDEEEEERQEHRRTRDKQDEAVSESKQYTNYI